MAQDQKREWSLENTDKSKYTYNRFGMKGARVGQAVYDILSKDQPDYTVEELLEGMNQKFLEGFEECIKNGTKEYHNEPFYVLVLQKKELTMLGVSNVVENVFVARKSEPRAIDLVQEYPHAVKILYAIDPKKGDFSIKWCMPDIEACKSIAKNPQSVDPQVYKWINQCFQQDQNDLVLSP